MAAYYSFNCILFLFVFQTFDIKLIGVTGGALIGPKNTTRIAILKNDSPNGLFRFATTAVRAFYPLEC